jgi:predicted acylesterase/phospholipase RssA
MQGEDPCQGGERRALILSGGGPKGAFQAGAVYHLVVHRNCDFHEFSGVSIGAVNAAFLAQAEEATDGTESHAELAAQAEGLVSLWESIKSKDDAVKGRPLGTLRFGLFGIESLNDFKPLRHLLEKNISPERLERGRPVRVGVTNFWDGGYREIASQHVGGHKSPANFLDYLYASAVPPVYGTMPRIRETGHADDPPPSVQYGDGSLRHITPVRRYFPVCRKHPDVLMASLLVLPPREEMDCDSGSGPGRTVQEPVQQLFVIVTSPYSRDSDLLPVTDPKCCHAGKREITKGPKILRRTLALMVDANYRWELDFLLFANDTLRWRWAAYQQAVSSAPAERLEEVKRQFRGATGFPLESYNRDPQDPDAPARPYEIGLVVPEKEYAEVGNMLVFSRPMVREQLYCGCIAADEMMQEDFGLASLAERCAARFPPLPKKQQNSAPAALASWQPMVCQTGRSASR